jgi:alpha-tubulin suppressor-like RCC1 family protein
VSAPQAALAASAARGLNFSRPPGGQISAGVGQTCAIEYGLGYCWGQNVYGELGNATTSSSSVPVPVKNTGALEGRPLTQISAGSQFNCALDTNAAAYCWGDNADGELGHGGTIESTVPIAVRTSGVLSGKTLTQISAGGQTACALATTGAAYCWGSNADGQLGNGSLSSSSVPVAVSTSGALNGKTLTRIAVGLDHTCALDSNGAAYCWGSNATGGLGDGNTTSSSVPVAVTAKGVLDGKTLTQITAGLGHTCALDSNGAAYCWGGPGLLLGSDSLSSSDTPVAVSTDDALDGKILTQISTSDDHTCALGSNGAAYCWGSGGSGQLGDASTGDANVPFAVSTTGRLEVRDLTQISSGGDDTCALDTARGAIFCWGADDLGQLGDNSSSRRDVPVLAGPDAPRHVQADSNGTSAKVFWTAPASLDTGNLISYIGTATPGSVQDAPQASPSGAQTCTTTGATSCIISGLVSGVTYRITVVAHTSVGYSGASLGVTIHTGSSENAGAPPT